MRFMIGLCLIFSLLLCLNISAEELELDERAYFYPNSLIGQPDYIHNTMNRVDGKGFNSPGGIAIDILPDPDHLYIADTSNNRILCWFNINEAFSGKEADIVLGQDNFWEIDSNFEGVNNKTLSGPSAMIAKDDGNIYVCDTYNNRILIFEPPFYGNTDPIGLLGQNSYTEGSANQGGSISRSGLDTPEGITVDSSKNVYVSDKWNNRVLIFNNPLGIGAGEDNLADTVFGQIDYTSGLQNTISDTSLYHPLGLALDESENLWVADSASNRAIRFSQTFSTFNSQGDKNTGQPDLFSNYNNWDGGNWNSNASPYPTGLYNPGSLLMESSGSLYVADLYNNRVLRWDDPTSANRNANFVFGQDGSFYLGSPGFPTGPKTLNTPDAMVFDESGRLYIVDKYNNRILRFDDPVNLHVADAVCGQGNFTAYETNRLDGASVNSPEDVAIDFQSTPNHIYIVDGNGHRILSWYSVERAMSGIPADIVLGQPDKFEISSGCGQNKLDTPVSIFVDNTSRVWISDMANNRIIGYDNPFTNDNMAEYLIGQSSWTSNLTNGGNATPTTDSLSFPYGICMDGTGALWVADDGNNRVLRFPVPSGALPQANLVIGQPDMESFLFNHPSLGPTTLWSPKDVAIANGDLFICDSSNNRILYYDEPETDTSADKVFGQLDSFYTNTFDIGSTVSARGLNDPTHLMIDNRGILLVTDNGNSRVLGYYGAPDTTSDTTADIVFGQTASFSSGGYSSPGEPATALKIVDAAGCTVDDTGNLYLADSGNNRVLIFHLATPPKIKSATYLDMDNSGGSANFGDRLILQFSEGLMLIDSPGLSAADFYLSHAGDSLGAGFDAWISYEDPTKIIIALGASPSLVITGSDASASSIDISENASSKLFSIHSLMPVISGIPKDIKFVFNAPPPTAVTPGQTYTLVDDPDALFRYHALYLPPGVPPGSYIFGFFPPGVDIPYLSAVAIRADTRADISLEFDPDSVDTEAGFMLKYMRLARLVEISPGVWEPVWQDNAEFTLDLDGNIITANLGELYGSRKDGKSSPWYGIDGDIIIATARDLIEENSINVQESGGRKSIKSDTGATLEPGTDCIYLNHGLNLPGFEEISSGGYEITIRQATSSDRTGFPEQSGAVLVIESSPDFPSDKGFNITIQYETDPDPALTDVIDLSGTSGNATKLRLVKKNTVSGVFEFVTEYDSVTMNDNSSITTSGVKNLTDSGFGIYGLAVNPAAEPLETMALSWEMYE
jgi:sugar lactone lactonase YvrE